MYRKQVRRRRAVLALLIISSFALLTATYGGGSGSLQRGVGTIFGPIQGAADRALKPPRDLVNWFDETFDARGENSRLKDQLAVTRKEAVGYKAALAQNREYSKLLHIDNSVVPSGYKPVTGTVIALSPTAWYSTVTIDTGSGAGVAVNDPVINGDGLVGHVTSVTGSTSQVALITDPGSDAVTGRIVPGGTQGTIKPTVGDPTSLTLEFIGGSKRIVNGQTVVTAGWSAPGFASNYPPNLPIGEVTQASIAEQEASASVQLRPFASMEDLSVLQVLTGGHRG